MKRLLSVLMAALMIALLLAGCGGGSQSSLAGEWVPEGGGRAPSGFPDDMEFFSDGTIVFEDMNGTYSIEGKRLKITILWEALTFDFEIRRDTLTLKQDGTSVVYARKQSSSNGADSDQNPRNSQDDTTSPEVVETVKITEARDFSDGAVWVMNESSTSAFWKCLDTKGETLFTLSEGKIPVTDFFNEIAVIATEENRLESKAALSSIVTYVYPDAELIDKTGKVVWSVGEQGTQEAERLFGANTVDSIQVVQGLEGYILVLFNIESFEFSGMKLGVLDYELNWFLNPTDERCSFGGYSFVVNDAIGLYHFVHNADITYYNMVINDFGGGLFGPPRDWTENIQISLSKDGLVYKHEVGSFNVTLDRGFYNANGEKVIDLLSYDIPSQFAPIFTDGYSVLTMANDQGSLYMTVINKQGEQMASPIKYQAHGNIANGLFWAKNEDGSHSYMNPKMEVVIANIEAKSVSDFTEDGLATIRNTDEIYFIDTAGKRVIG